jgi:hypothetical protein
MRGDSILVSDTLGAGVGKHRPLKRSLSDELAELEDEIRMSKVGNEPLPARRGGLSVKKHKGAKAAGAGCIKSDEDLAAAGDAKAIHRLKSRAYKHSMSSVLASGGHKVAAKAAASIAYAAESRKWKAA